MNFVLFMLINLWQPRLQFSSNEILRRPLKYEVTCPFKIPVIVKNIRTELPTILAKLYNCCLEREILAKFVECVGCLPCLSRMKTWSGSSGLFWVKIQFNKKKKKKDATEKERTKKRERKTQHEICYKSFLISILHSSAPSNALSVTQPLAFNLFLKSGKLSFVYLNDTFMTFCASLSLAAWTNF